MITVSMIEKIEQEVGPYKGDMADIKLYFCPKCGTQVERKHRYCWFCGQSIKPKADTLNKRMDTFEKEQNTPKYTVYDKNASLK